MLSYLLIEFLIIHSLSTCTALPLITCNFSSITKFKNQTYFVTDIKSNFWRVKDGQPLDQSSILGKLTDIQTNDTKQLKEDGDFKTFDLTFTIDFDEKCSNKSENMTGYSFTRKNEFVYTIYHSERGNWSDLHYMSENIKGLNGTFMKEARALSHIKFINAVLIFHKQIFIIQGNDLIRMGCDTAQGWKILNGKIVYKPDIKIDYNEIYGGLVDNNFVYLFQGNRKLETKIRDYYYKCNYTLNQNLILDCKKQEIVCKGSKKNDNLIIIIVSAIAGGIGIVLICLCIFLVCSLFCKTTKDINDSKNTKNQSEKRFVNEGQLGIDSKQNVEQSVGQTAEQNVEQKEEPKNLGVARVRTFGKPKPGLARNRTIDFSKK